MRSIKNKQYFLHFASFFKLRRCFSTFSTFLLNIYKISCNQSNFYKIISNCYKSIDYYFTFFYSSIEGLVNLILEFSNAVLVLLLLLSFLYRFLMSQEQQDIIEIRYILKISWVIIDFLQRNFSKKIIYISPKLAQISLISLHQINKKIFFFLIKKNIATFN